MPVALKYVKNKWGIGVLAHILKNKCDFTLVYSILWFYTFFLNLEPRTLFAPVLDTGHRKLEGKIGELKKKKRKNNKRQYFLHSVA